MTDGSLPENGSIDPEKFPKEKVGEFADELRQEAYEHLSERPNFQGLFAQSFNPGGNNNRPGKFNGVNGEIERIEDPWHLKITATFDYPSLHSSGKEKEIIVLEIPNPIPQVSTRTDTLGRLRYELRRHDDAQLLLFEDDPNAYHEISTAFAERFTPRPIPPLKAPDAT